MTSRFFLAAALMLAAGTASAQAVVTPPTVTAPAVTRPTVSPPTVTPATPPGGAGTTASTTPQTSGVTYGAGWSADRCAAARAANQPIEAGACPSPRAETAARAGVPLTPR